MADILGDVERFEERIQTILKKAQRSPALQAWSDAVQTAILSILDKYSLAELKEIDVESLIQSSIEASGITMSKDLAKEISSNIQTLINETSVWYKERGEEFPDLTEAVRRHDTAKKMNFLFSEGMKTVKGKLLDTSLQVFEEAIKSGRIDRDQIAIRIAENAVTSKQYATIQTSALLSGYNQLSRNVVRDTTSIEHGFYYGKHRKNTRLFCDFCIGNTYLLEDIEKMKNGMLEPVKLNRGGYQCIHSWLWVRPEWDPKFKTVIGSPKEFMEGNHRIVVIIPSATDNPILAEEIRLASVFGIPKNRVDLQKMDPKISTRYVDQYQNLVKDYRVKVYSVDVKNHNTYDAWVDNEKRGYLHFSDRVHDSAEFLEWRIKNVTEQGHLSPVEPVFYVERTAVHEFFHLMARSRVNNKDFFDKIDPIYKEHLTREKEIRNSQRNTPEMTVNDMYELLRSEIISEYGLYDIDEFGAECFTNYKLSSNPKPIAQKVGKMIDDYFRRK